MRKDDRFLAPHISLIPEKVSLGYRTIKIEITGPHEAEMLGHYEPHGSLHVSPNYDEAETVNTVLHELIHAIWHVYSVNTMMDWEEGNDEEEKLVNILANGMTELMARNPDFVKYVWETLHGGDHQDS